jgi:hypothetical protein
MRILLGDSSDIWPRGRNAHGARLSCSLAFVPTASARLCDRIRIAPHHAGAMMREDQFCTAQNFFSQGATEIVREHGFAIKSARISAR